MDPEIAALLREFYGPDAVDAATGEPLPLTPIADPPVTPRDERSLGSRVGNEDLATARDLVLGSANLYDMLPESYRGGVMEPVNRGLGKAATGVLGLIMGAGGLASKGMGYGADALGLDLRPGDIPDTEAMGQLGDALYALPTARAVSGLLATTGRAERSAASARVAEQAKEAGLTEAGRQLADPVLGLTEPLVQRARQGQLPTYAYMTHEAQPYAAVGRNVLEGDVGVDPSPFLPASTRMTEIERLAFFEDPRRSWIDPETGGDILSQEVGARTLPTLRGQGIYSGPDGVETNPVSIGRSYATEGQLTATESLRGLVDIQGATPWVRLRSGDLPAIYLKRDGAADLDTMQQMMDTGSKYGLPDVIDVGEGYIVTNFDGDGSVSRRARKALEEVSGLSGVSTKAQSGYPGYEGAWERGAGQAIGRFLGHIEDADPDALAALEASAAVRRAAQGRAMLAREAGAELGGSNKVVEEMLRTVGRGPGFVDRLQNYATRLEARRIEPQIPQFSVGTSEPIRATHYSAAPRAAIDPAFSASNPNIAGAERALPSPYPAQSYFGVGVGTPGGYVKESGLGDVIHDVSLPTGLFNLAEGWGDISDEAERIVSRIEAASGAMTPSARDAALQAYRMRIAKMRGYTGLYNPQHKLGSIATTFYPVKPTYIEGPR